MSALTKATAVLAGDSTHCPQAVIAELADDHSALRRYLRELGETESSIDYLISQMKLLPPIAPGSDDELAPEAEAQPVNQHTGD